MIECRKVTPEEKLYVTRLQSIVFSNNRENEEEIREQIAKGEYDSDDTKSNGIHYFRDFCCTCRL